MFFSLIEKTFYPAEQVCKTDSLFLRQEIEMFHVNLADILFIF